MAPARYEKSGLEWLREATPDVVTPPVRNRNDYPHIKFWEEHEWELWTKDGKESGSFKSCVQGEGVNSSWMEYATGERVDLGRQKKILGEARRTWVTMRNFKVKLDTFREMGAPTVEYFRARMELKFPELQLCADHWKADKIWGENYSSWANEKRSKKVSQPGPQSETASRFQSHESTL